MPPNASPTRIGLSLAASFLFSTALTTATAASTELHVSPSGKPGASGTTQDPLPSLKDADRKSVV